MSTDGEETIAARVLDKFVPVGAESEIANGLLDSEPAGADLAFRLAQNGASGRTPGRLAQKTSCF